MDRVNKRGTRRQREIDVSVSDENITHQSPAVPHFPVEVPPPGTTPRCYRSTVTLKSLLT